MSVRSRIEAFEALSKDTDNSNESHTKKRFQYPGPNRHSNTEQTQPSSFLTSKPAKTQGLTDFESDLQEVWSVRKNIHHQGGKQSSSHQHSAASSSLPSVQAAGHYSRHGAIAAQQSQGASVLPKSSKDPIAKSHASTVSSQNDDEFSFETRRTPLQEQNFPWNVKKSNAYSYNSSEVPSKRPVGSPGMVNGVASPPTAKRRSNIGEADVVRSTKANDLMFPAIRKPDEKVSYAKRMANSYLRSVGIGEYTPGPQQETRSSSNSVVTQKKSSTRWKHSDHDDFNF